MALWLRLGAEVGANGVGTPTSPATHRPRHAPALCQFLGWLASRECLTSATNLA